MCSLTVALGSTSRIAPIWPCWSRVIGALFNQYGVMLVSSAKHPQVKTGEGQKFVDWVTGPAGQAAIASYRIGGEQLFFPNAVK
jgi:ABC-type tungstate transport system permease subunit